MPDKKKKQQSQMDAESIAKTAIDIVKTEKSQWEDAAAFVTDKVAFNMRNIIRRARKNFYGVFDEPKIGPHDKIWDHVTQEFADAVCKNVDMDTKDINFRAKHPSAVGKAKVIRSKFRNYLDRTYFGQDADELIKAATIDGTAVWLTTEDYDKDTNRKTAKRTLVDLLNVYIDPTARSIQEAYRFTVRILMTESEVRAMKGDWINTEGIEGTFGLARTDTDALKGATPAGSGSKLVDVWRMHGKGPKYLITGQKDDTEEIDLEIICSGLDSPGKARVHLLQKYSGLKPYEEMWLFRVPGRWYGMGVPEKLMYYQLWANSVVNTRITRSRISQLGIFQVRKGSGITQQMLSRLATNGVIPVTELDRDIKQLPIDEASEASYRDDDIIRQRAMRITGSYEAATGEALPSSTPATNAAIQNNAAQSGFTLIKEGFGFFFERWIKRHALPIEMKQLKIGDVIRMELDPDEIRKQDENQVNSQIAAQLEQINAAGQVVDPMQVDLERKRALVQLQNTNERFVEVDELIDWMEHDVEVVVTNEKIDKGVLSSNLLTAIQLAPEYKDQIIAAAFDLWGVDIKTSAAPLQPQPPMGAPQVPTQNPQQVMTQANTMQGYAG